MATEKPRQGRAWKFTSSLRARAFSWRSSALATRRLKEAVAEVKQASALDPQRAADGAVLLISKIEPAFEQVDSSSGALGSAVGKAIRELAPVIGAGASDLGAQRKRLEKLFQAVQEADIGYLDGPTSVGDLWGEMCGSQELAAEWADRLAPTLAQVWTSPEWSYFKGTSACLSSLLAAGQHQRLLDLLALQEKPQMWSWREFGVRALRQEGRLEEALALARQRCINDDVSLDLACEDLLIALGREAEAYREFGLQLRRAGTYKATFSALCKRYPQRSPRQILRDLVDSSPDPGPWFTAAMGLGELDIARQAARSARDPRTLTRAARAEQEKNPAFAFEIAVIALDSIDDGAGYEIKAGEVLVAYDVAKAAAAAAGLEAELQGWLDGVGQRKKDSFVKRVMGNFRIL